MYTQAMPVNVPFRPSVTFQVRSPLLVLVDESCHADTYCTTERINTTLCTAGAPCAIAESNRPALLWPRRGPMIDKTVERNASTPDSSVSIPCSPWTTGTSQAQQHYSKPPTHQLISGSTDSRSFFLTSPLNRENDGLKGRSRFKSV